MNRRQFILASAATFLVGTSLSMVTYHGGSEFYPNATGYSFTQNFFSDLGMRSGYSQQPISPWTNLLFGLSLIAAGVGGHLFFATMRELIDDPRAKRVSTILSLLFLACIVAVPFVPSDIYTWPHRYLVVAAVFFLAASSVLSATLTPLQGWRKMAFRAYGLLSVVYLLGIVVAPLPSSSLAARTGHAIAQKVIIFGFVGLYTVWVLGDRKGLE